MHEQLKPRLCGNREAVRQCDQPCAARAPTPCHCGESGGDDPIKTKLGERFDLWDKLTNTQTKLQNKIRIETLITVALDEASSDADSIRSGRRVP